MIYDSYAKINLFLHINSKRDDGYHNLQTWFTFVDLKDELSFEFNNSGIINIQSDKTISNKEDNLIYKAIDAFRETYGVHHVGVDVDVVKNIPMGAGLGGGSSNAATTLIAMRDFCDASITNIDMLEIGAKLGADVPIFLYGQSAWAEGVGDILSPKKFDPCHLLLVKPNVHVSTKEFFESKSLIKTAMYIDKDAKLDLSATNNDFENVFYAKFPEIKKYLMSVDEDFRMTGTGSCFYLLSKDRHILEKVATKIDKLLDKWLVKTLNYVY
jgi:4-diphosphocytidyl-2-C-methyl-D-erythritol kinase